MTTGLFPKRGVSTETSRLAVPYGHDPTPRTGSSASGLQISRCAGDGERLDRVRGTCTHSRSPPKISVARTGARHADRPQVEKLNVEGSWRSQNGLAESVTPLGSGIAVGHLPVACNLAVSHFSGDPDYIDKDPIRGRTIRSMFAKRADFWGRHSRRFPRIAAVASAGERLDPFHHRPWCERQAARMARTP